MDYNSNQYTVVQIHPTLRCNLRCLHCYSLSGPAEHAALDAGVLCQSLTTLYEQGYRVASFSGGEPLLYKPLPQVLAHARQLGMSTSIATNGMLLDEKRLDSIRDVTSLIAISLDGTPESHNRNRASDRAFEIMASRLEGIRQTGIPFGFIFTLTQYNLNELPWVAAFALEQGAALLQIHPLESVGRADETMPDAVPDEIELAYAFEAAYAIQAQAAGRMVIHFDAATRHIIRMNPQRVYAEGNWSEEALLAEMVSPLVIEADGTVSPLEYGIHRRYTLGNLNQASMNTLIASWRREDYPTFVELCARAYDEITRPAESGFVNWYQVLVTQAEIAGAALAS